MENQILSPQRFAAYMKKYVVERKKNILIVSATIFLLMIFFCVAYPYFFSTYNFNFHSSSQDPMWSRETTFFGYVMFGISLVCASFYFPLAKKQSRMALFTCPASSFEKFLTYFIFFVIALPIIGITATFLGDAIRVWIYSGHAVKGIEVNYLSPSYLFTLGHTDFILICAFWFGYLLNQSIYALGSCVWPKSSVIKTSCFILLFNIIASILIYMGMKAAFAIHNPYNANIMYGTSLSENQVTWIFNSTLIFITLSAWVISYFRFKEWEIIKRW